MQPPPRKGNFYKICKNLHSEQYSKLQAKNQQECDLLEDIRNFTKQRSSIEKSYGEALCKIAANYQNRKIACVPDIRLEDGSEAWNVYSVWRTVLDETEKLGKARLAAVEVFHQRISEDAKHTRQLKIHLGKKLTENLKIIQQELQTQVHDLERCKRNYYAEENVAHDAREKATDAESKLKRKKGSIFQSISSLQRNSAKFTAKKEMCDEKSSGARNDYLLSLASSNAHQRRYHELDFERIMRTMECEMFDKVAEYLTLMSRTELLTCTASQYSYTRIKEQAQTINRGYNIRCYLTFYPMLGHSIQYEFEPCKGDRVDKIVPYDDPTKEALDSEARKGVAKIQRELKVIKDSTKKMQKLQTGHKNDAGEYHPDIEAKLDDLRQSIRRAQTIKMKVEAKLELLKEGGIEVEDYTKTMDTDSIGTDLDTPLSRADSTASVKEEVQMEVQEEEEEEEEQNIPDDRQHSVESMEQEKEQLKQQQSLDPVVWDPMNVDWGDAPVSPLPPVTNGPAEEDTQIYPKCIVLYNYEAQNPDELTIVENEQLELVSEGDGDGWVQTRNAKGEVGYVPQNYIEMEGQYQFSKELPSQDYQETQEVNNIQQTSTEYQNGQTFYDDQVNRQYSVEESTSAPPSEVPPPPPPEIITEEVTSGEMPVLDLPPKTHIDQSKGDYCIAVYDYEATCDEELTFEEGTLLRITKKNVSEIDDGWWEGSIDGLHGLFPALVVEECRCDGEPLSEDAYSISSTCMTPPPHTPPEVPGFLLPPEKVIITQPTPDVETVEEAMAAKGKENEKNQSGKQQKHYQRQFSSSPDSEATMEKDQYAELVSSPDVSNQEEESKNEKIQKVETKEATKSDPPDLGVAQIIVTAATPMVEPPSEEIKTAKSNQEDSRIEADQQEDDSHADSEDIEGEAIFLEDDRPPPPPPAPEGGGNSMMKKEESKKEDEFKQFKEVTYTNGKVKKETTKEKDVIEEKKKSDITKKEKQKTEKSSEKDIDTAKAKETENKKKEKQKTEKSSEKDINTAKAKECENKKKEINKPVNIPVKPNETDSLDSTPTPKSPTPSDGPPELDPEKLKALDKIKESIA